jgi:hypothetical protein
MQSACRPFPQITAHVRARIGMQNVDLSRHVQRARHHRCAGFRIEQIDDERHRGIASPGEQRLQCGLVAVHQNDARARR